MDNRLKEVINTYDNIVIFSGAGVSTLSGISDYKSGFDYWSAHKEDYFSHQEIMSNRMYELDKPLFFEYYQKMVEGLKNKEPNAAHYLANELQITGKLLGVITQNIDGLYDGLIPKEKLCEIHGNIKGYTCVKCGEFVEDVNVSASKRGILHSDCCNWIVKPNVVLYGEVFKKEYAVKYKEMLKKADCILVMGTRLDVLTHNVEIGSSNAFKVLINNDKVPLYKRKYGTYSMDNVEINWGLEIIDDVKNSL